MKTALLAWLLIWSATGHSMGGQELPRFGPAPEVGKDWKVREQGTNGSNLAGWGWLVFTNAQTGDALLFAAQSMGNQGFAEATITWSDMAGDLFPGGFLFWNRAGPRFTANWIRNNLTEVGAMDPASKQYVRVKALEYTLVFEPDDKGAPNRLSHGYAMTLGQRRVFIQHVSTTAITADLARGLASLMFRAHLDRKAAQEPDR